MAKKIKDNFWYWLWMILSIGKIYALETAIAKAIQKAK